jgi:hypothetical protein
MHETQGKDGFMAENELETRPRGPFLRFPLDNVANTRASFARLIRAYARGRIDAETYRNLVYGLSSYSNFLKSIKDDEFEQRLNLLEEVAAGEKRITPARWKA